MTTLEYSARRQQGLSSIEPNDAGNELDGGKVACGLLVAGGDHLAWRSWRRSSRSGGAHHKAVDRSRAARTGCLAAGSPRSYQQRPAAQGRAHRRRTPCQRSAYRPPSSAAGGPRPPSRVPRRRSEAQSGCPARRPGRGSWCSVRRASNRLVLTSFWAPALCWWARTMVLSIIAYSLSASAANVETPAPRHRSSPNG